MSKHALNTRLPASSGLMTFAAVGTTAKKLSSNIIGIRIVNAAGRLYSSRHGHDVQRRSLA